MKQEHLQQIITTLETDYKNGLPMSAITVENISNPENVFNILCNTNNDELVKQYGSATKFFETQANSNVNSIRIQPQKRNGTFAGGTKVNWKKSTKIKPLEITFKSNEMLGKPKEILTKNKPKIQDFKNKKKGQKSKGLSGFEYHKIHDHQRLLTENTELKTKNNHLETENKRLEKEVLTGELVGQKSVEKTQAQAELVKAGQGYLPVVLQFFETIKGAQVPGLSGANLSPVKERFLKADDELLIELEQVGMRCENQDFIDELKSLINKYPVQNA